MPVIEVEFRRQRSMASATAHTHPAPDRAGDDGWPTTLRFSRHVGEHVRTVGYAAAIERPCESPIAVGVIVGVILAAVAGAVGLVLWHAG
jgi:hypothetical protein